MRRLLQENKKRTGFRDKIKSFPKEKVILIGLVLFFLTLVVQVLEFGLFKVKNIECRTQYSQCSQEDIQVFEKFKESNLLFLNTDEIKKTGEENFSNSKVYAQRIFPATLSIVLEKRKPVIALTSDDPRSPILLVGQDGTIVEVVKEQTALPKIKVNRELKNLFLGQKVEIAVIHAVQTMYLTYKAQAVTEGILNKDNLQLTLPSGISVYFALDRDPQALVGALQLIETRSRIEGKLPKLIDLRYIKPVLMY